MKNFLCIALFILCIQNGIFAQNHFLYIQSENRSPFTVTLKNKNYNSTSTGYVIIPRLSRGDYELSVKFLQQDIPTAKFNVFIEKKDIGFSLKAINSTAAITNIQTYITHTTNEKPVYASNNTSIRPEIKATTTANAEEKALTAKNTRKGVSKVYEIQGSIGVSLRYVDYQEIATDTIDIVIPIEKVIPEKAFDNIARAERNKAKPQLSKVESGLQLLAVHQQGYNKTCVNLASGDDFYKLKRKMTAESAVEKMLIEVQKVAKNKCFTTIQIKNLASLFVADKDKLQFFKAVQPVVYDYIQFPTLEKEFSELSYAELFRATIYK